MCKKFFSFDELKDLKIEMKVELSNGTKTRIPLCKTCDWDLGKAEKHMIKLWSLESKKKERWFKKLKIKRIA